MTVEIQVAARDGQPISAELSSSGASGTGARTPITVNQLPPSHTCTSGPAAGSPSRSAAAAPSTTAGYREVASLSQVPLATSAPTVSSSPSCAARTAMPPVSAAGIRSVR